MNLSSRELERYRRQIGPGVLSEAAQLRLKESTAMVTRVGGMGGPAALMLTMAGIGRVIIAHGGELISPDLNRQVLGTEEDLGLPRIQGFARRLRAANRFVDIQAIDHEPDDAEAVALARKCNVLLSCPPTFDERLRLNRAAVEAGIPLVDAAQWGMTGTLIVVRPGETACLACIYPETPPFEESFPVIGAISSAIGSLAALEAIKIISLTGQPLWGKMLIFDGYGGAVNTIELSRRESCPVCGGGRRAEP
jgi:molybdopterin/thiamine biosynthesis adenylyltransferase